MRGNKFIGKQRNEKGVLGTELTRAKKTSGILARNLDQVPILQI